MTTWLSDAGANRHIKTYVKDFLDVSGNFTVRQNGSTIFNPADTENFIPDVLGFTDNASDEINTTTIKTVQFKYEPDSELTTIEDSSFGLVLVNSQLSKYESGYPGANTQISASSYLVRSVTRHKYPDEIYGLRFFTNNKSRMRIDRAGGVLNVLKSDYSMTRGAYRWGFQVGDPQSQYTTNMGGFSVYAFGVIAAAASSLYGVRGWSYSDRRIKQNIQEINDASALEKLRLLNPCTYKYIDKRKVGHENDVEGFIAQEVKEVVPYAVSQLPYPEAIPNIYSLGSYEIDGSGNKIITIPDYDTANLEVDASGNFFPKLRIYDETNNKSEVLITKVVSSNSLQIKTDIKLPKEIVVFGQVIDNFLTISKANIFTIATAALQELDRQLQAEKLKKATLETQVADLRARVNVLKGQ